ncbi:hypothetical protein DICVIV_13411 [Dictyocaulus viviparus]|uniref:Uncharacterized protein n=1 Tax=Dictyocaulus viviparus TaxID=29172 RepID=A0A0D8XA39_DICVI|nr:hypothetical protein DICVIV_13411 [Dictyocaulus viviparus]
MCCPSIQLQPQFSVLCFAPVTSCWCCVLPVAPKNKFPILSVQIFIQDNELTSQNFLNESLVEDIWFASHWMDSSLNSHINLEKRLFLAVVIAAIYLIVEKISTDELTVQHFVQFNDVCNIIRFCNIFAVTTNKWYANGVNLGSMSSGGWCVFELNTVLIRNSTHFSLIAVVLLSDFSNGIGSTRPLVQLEIAKATHHYADMRKPFVALTSHLCLLNTNKHPIMARRNKSEKSRNGKHLCWHN